MGVGCAIVGSNTDPVKEVINSNETGLLVNFFDWKNLVVQILKLLEKPDLREKLGCAARRLIVENYDLKTICLGRQLEWVGELGVSPGKLNHY
ncbi:glycosyltransferase [Cellvibrio sp.]|uniref:glycosyltransferase n=1 Tax=Cellvibrio sp. TaxID=1965322 RepID=UPI0039647EA4